MKKYIFVIMVIGLLALISAAEIEITNEGTETGRIINLVPPTIPSIAVSGNLTNFTELIDTPASYAGSGDLCVAVNSGETALEFISCAAAGDTNETVRITNLVSADCAAGTLVIGVQNNGTVLCAVDAGIDAVINNTDGWIVNFSKIQSDAYQTDQGTFVFNLYDDGSEAFINATSVGDAFGIEVENSKLILFNDPTAGNDFKVLQVFSKQAQDTTEFVVTKAGDAHTSYFIRSLAITGNGSTIATPFNCSSYANYIDCRTDQTGADFYVVDDAEINGTLYVGEGINATDWNNVSINISQVPGIDIFINESGDTMTGDLNFLDDINATFGTGDDAKIRYDGTDLIINPREVGSGSVVIGTGEAGIDYKLIFDGENSDGNITFDEGTGTGLFRIDNDILFSLGKATSYRETGNKVFSATTNQLSLEGARGIGSSITFSAGAISAIEFLRIRGSSGVIVNENGNLIADFRAETDNNPFGIFLDAGVEAIGFFTDVLTHDFNVVGTSNFTGDMDILGNVNVEGNITNGACGTSFQFEYSESGTHTTGQAWFENQARNQRGWRIPCDAIIRYMTVGWDVDPLVEAEFIHVHVDNSNVECSLNVTITEGDNAGLTNTTCNVIVSAGSAITVEGDFGAGGTSMNDGVAIVGGNYVY